MLKDKTGKWVQDQQDLSELVFDYFSCFFHSAISSEIPRLHTTPSTSDPCAAQAHLVAPFEMAEVRRPFFEMNPSKAPEPNGIQAYFFQFGWPVVQNSLLKLANHVLLKLGDIKDINRTFISLIPKKDLVADFRPIILCNTSYTLIYKLIVNHLKPLLSQCISPCQSNFILGGNIVYNIILLKEIPHSIARSKNKTKPMAIKVDLSKAYDSLEWNFIRDKLVYFQIPPILRDLIMSCITACTMQVLWNSQPGYRFQPSRGIRQGDSLSPYIFTLCMERLSRLIQYKVLHWRWVAFKIRSFQASHVFYEDDVVLFGGSHSS